jgi:hypothetical protein
MKKGSEVIYPKMDGDQARAVPEEGNEDVYLKVKFSCKNECFIQTNVFFIKGMKTQNLKERRAFC